MAVYLDVTVDVRPRSYAPATFRTYWWSVGRWFALLAIFGTVMSILVLAQHQTMILLWIGLGVIALGLLGGPIFAFSRLLSPQRSPIQVGQFHFVANDEGVVVEGPAGAAQLKWTAYKKAYIDHEFLYLMLSSQQAQCIPVSHAGDLIDLRKRLDAMGLLRPTPRSFFVA